MFGHFTVNEYGVSFVTDNMILMRYVELEGHVARALSVLKMRGSDHDKSVREYHISATWRTRCSRPWHAAVRPPPVS